MRCSRKTALAALMLAAFALTSCRWGPPSRRELLVIASAWFTAVQERNFDRLAHFDANAPPAGDPAFAAWKDKVNQILDRTEAQKLEGHWTPDETGYALVRQTLIGANPGTFWGAPGREGTFDAPVLIIRATFAYDELAQQHLPEGTVAWIQGHPVGTVYRLVIGRGEKRQVDILDSVRMKVHFVRVPNPGKNDPPYRISRLELIEGSDKHRLVTWVF